MNRVLEGFVQQRPFHRVALFSYARSVLMGAGIAYAIEKEKLWQLPIVAVVPSVYAGYQGFKNRADVLGFLKGYKPQAQGAGAQRPPPSSACPPPPVDPQETP